MNSNEDWRLFREQERYLTGAHLIYHYMSRIIHQTTMTIVSFAWLNSEKAMPI